MRHTRALPIALVTSVLVATAAPVSAQMSLGISAGYVSANFVGDDVDELDPESVSGFSLGGWLGIPLGGRFSVSPGAFYVQKGASADEPGTGTLAFDIAYLEIPVLLSVRLTSDDSNVGFSLFAGPAVGFEASCDVSLSDGTETFSASCDDADFADRQSLDVGALAGAGVQFPLGERLDLMLSGGIDMGLRTLDTSDNPDDVKNRAFFGSAGVVIPLGG